MSHNKNSFHALLSPSETQKYTPSNGVLSRRLKVNHWFSANKVAPEGSRLGHPMVKKMTRISVYRTADESPSASASRSRLPFGSIVEDPLDSVSALSAWNPPPNDVRPEDLPSHYRTTTKHGSTAHTVWDFVWEKPVVREPRIEAEMRTFDPPPF
jgi:hypothetical protein